MARKKGKKKEGNKFIPLDCKYPNTKCHDCKEVIRVGEKLRWNPNKRSPIRYLCEGCFEAREAPKRAYFRKKDELDSTFDSMFGDSLSADSMKPL